MMNSHEIDYRFLMRAPGQGVQSKGEGSVLGGFGRMIDGI
jgi:hypothetical protein